MSESKKWTMCDAKWNNRKRTRGERMWEKNEEVWMRVRKLGICYCSSYRFNPFLIYFEFTFHFLSLARIIFLPFLSPLLFPFLLSFLLLSPLPVIQRFSRSKGWMMLRKVGRNEKDVHSSLARKHILLFVSFFIHLQENFFHDFSLSLLLLISFMKIHFAHSFLHPKEPSVIIW